MAIEFDFVPANFDHLDCRTRKEHPELFRPKIKRPAGDLFTYEEFIEFLELSPANLVSCLRRHKDIIKIYSATLTKQDRDWFYDYSVDPVECLYAFHDARFHYVEVRALRHALVAERQELGEPGVQVYLGEVWGEPLEGCRKTPDVNLTHQKTEYVPAEDLRKGANLSPSRFVELLREHRDWLPLHGFFSDNERTFFYNEDVEPVMAADMLSDKTIHHLDWENFILEMEKEGQENADATTANIWSYVTRRDELQSEEKDARIAKLEKELTAAKASTTDTANAAELQTALEEKDARIAGLEKELVTVKAGLENGKSLANVVCRMRREGKNDEEIAAHLHDDGKWCSQAQVGALLHADETRIAAESMSQRARRLLGKA